VKPLNEDTLADKVLRLVIGGILGAIAGLFFMMRVRAGAPDQEYVRTILLFAGIVGLISVLLGNRFIERFLQRRWWH